MKLIKKEIKKFDYWRDLSIPAKLFFYNLNNDDLSFLVKEGEVKESDLKQSWSNIQDEYYKQKSNKKSSLMMSTRNVISFLILKINTCKMVVNLLMKMPFSKDQVDYLIKKIETIGIRLPEKLSLDEKLILIIEQYIPSWETELELEKDNFSKHSKEEVVSYEDALESICDVKGRYVPDDISLARFLALEKSAIKTNQENIKNSQKSA